MDAFFIILTAVFVVVSTSVLGSFLVLRRMAMIGDAISHAVLPGIVLAFLWSGSRNPWAMLVGAVFLGWFTAYAVQFLEQRVGLQSDAAIGVSFTSLFALGVVLITWYASEIDLDQDCVLYGEIAYVPIDVWVLSSGKFMGPRSLYVMGGAMGLTLLFVLCFYKQLLITSFDPKHAASLGISVQRWHYALMSAVSFVIVAAFEVVGAILVVAFLVAPSAAAYLLTRSLPKLLLLSALLGCVAVGGGYVLATVMDASIAGSMASCAGVVFGLCWVYVRLLGGSGGHKREDSTT